MTLRKLAGFFKNGQFLIPLICDILLIYINCFPLMCFNKICTLTSNSLECLFVETDSRYKGNTGHLQSQRWQIGKSKQESWRHVRPALPQKIPQVTARLPGVTEDWLVGSLCSSSAEVSPGYSGLLMSEMALWIEHTPPLGGSW